MANDTTYSLPVVDDRGAAFGRLASRVLEALNDAVDQRRQQGVTLATLADRIGCHRSQLSRTLNGTVSNLTLRTVSDILWATNFDPRDFSADPIETLTPNGFVDFDPGNSFNEVLTYDTSSLVSNSDFAAYSKFNRSNMQKFEVVPG